MEVHRVAHKSRHLVVASVVGTFHRMKDAPLNGLQTIGKVGHSALQNNVRSIVKKPGLVHSRKLVLS